MDCYCGCFFHCSHYCNFHKNPGYVKSHRHWSKPNMAVFYIPILIFTGTKRIEWLFFCVYACSKSCLSDGAYCACTKCPGQDGSPHSDDPCTPTHQFAPPDPPACPFVSALSTHTHPHPNLGDIWCKGVGLSFEGRERRRRGRGTSASGSTLSCPAGWEVRDGGRKETCVCRIVGGCCHRVKKGKWGG